MDMICSRAQDRFQIYNENGDVRLCGWAEDAYVGNLIDQTIEEVYCSARAKHIKERHAAKDYSLCREDSCPYVARGITESMLVPYERDRRFPKQIAIGFERVCNYACPSCTIHNAMVANTKCDKEKNYDIIEKRIREAMPHITEIGANGCGELFVSKRTLGILADWRPIESAEKCKVGLETNGSLFDKQHWEQIENLGQYHLSVAVTIMSFDEAIYQYLSGCKLHIDQIIDNLRFVRELRRKNVINRLELATVVQEQNFREMPSFVKRCIEEFEADDVRLRPFEPWGAESRDVAWFKDIRVADHPLHSEYKKVMSDPIFKHPKCSEGSGGLDAGWTDKSPFRAELKNQELMAWALLNPELLKKRVECFFGQKPVVVYGVEAIGKVVSKALADAGCNLQYIISYIACEKELLKRPVIALNQLTESEDRNVGVIITPLHAKRRICFELERKGYKDIVTIEDLFNER